MGLSSHKNIESFYPLTPMQQGILFHSLAAPESDIYFEQFSWSIQGKLNVAAFRRAWQHIFERYEVPRTGFVWEGLKEPVQVVYRQVALPWQQYNWLHLSPVEQQQQLELFLAGDRKQGFELKRPPLMRLTLIHLSEDSYNFTWSHHHLLFDGWSGSRICQEVFSCYNAFSHNQDVDLEPIRAYRDYIVWLQQQDLSQAEAFWRQLLKGFTAPTKLRIDKSSGQLLTLEQDDHQHEIRLSTEKTAALRLLAQQHQLTLNILVQGAWALLLSRYSGQDDVVFGATTSGRPPTLTQVESMVGLFINTLPVRVQVSPDECLLPWLKQIQTQQLETLQYEYSPLVKVQGWSEVPRGLPLFESLVVFENYPVTAALRMDLDFEVKCFSAFEKTNYPLNLMVNPRQELLLRIAYDHKRFDTNTITQMLGHLQTLIEGIIANHNQRLSELPLLTEAERHQLLVEWNDTQAEYPQECIHQWVEAQVAQTPDAVAVVFEAQQLTYRELNARANQVAHYLRKLGVKPEVLVGLCVARSPLMVIALLAILKAGGAYVPLDPAYPKERLAFMMQDAQVAVLLTQQSLLDELPDHQAQVVCLDRDWTLIGQESQANPLNQTQATNLAYLIYTSGSTGTPKGVMIPHRSLVNYTKAIGLEYEIAASDRVLQFASISFDVAAEEIFPCLVQGATLVLRTDEMLSSVSEFLQQSRNLGLTVLNLPTTFWHQVTAELSVANLALPEPVRLMIIGGERALPERLKTWRQWVDRRVRLVNCYGPTETTIGATICDLSGPRAVETAGRELPIGKALQNIQTYVLDSSLQPVPIGVPGELYLGGVGVARGYRDRAALTAEQFIPNPYSDGERLYRTGDLVRYRPDGNLEYLGRMDAQIKIRGFRIELGEIEAALSQHPTVRETAVLAQEKVQGEKRLVAYIVTEQKLAPHISELRRFLKQKLPEYMVPAVFVQLEGVPLTPNGKLDHKALPEPDTTRPELEKAFVAPRTSVEMKLSQIWAQVLGVQHVGIYDNFFELGGDSILTIQIVARANQAGLQLTPKQLFEHQNVAELAAVALTKQALEAEQGVTGASLTPIQKWFFEQNLPESQHFNQAVSLEVRQPLDLALLEQALRHLLLHHDALCLQFEPIESGWQQVQSSLDSFVPLTRWDFSALTAAEQKSAIAATATELQASLNLSTGPLVRVGFLDLGVRQPSRLLLVIHRLVVDRVSWQILLEDLQTAYQQLVRGETVQLPTTASFQQWSQKLREYSRSDALQQEKDYWLAESWKQAIALPVDWPEGENTIASMGRLSSTLSFQETQALLEDVPKAYNTQTSDVLLTALLQAFTQWTGERTLLVNLEGDGRDFEGLDLSRTVGWFTAVFPVLLNLKQASNPGDALKGVKEQLRNVPNQGIGYGVLRYLSDDQNIAAQLSALPQAEVMFNYLGQFDPMLAESSLFGLAPKLSGLGCRLPGKRCHLEINGWVSQGQLQLNWSYSQAVHHRSTVETLAENFVKELRTIISHCQSVEAGGFTPSDFSEAQLSQQELDQFLAKINRRR